MEQSRRALKIGSVYCIDWIDHYEEPGDQAWHDVGRIKPSPSEQRSVGYLIKETDELITVAHTLDKETDQCSAPFHILKGAIRGIRKLTLPKAKDEVQ